MVELTRFNDTRFLINTELIEMVEETPDTVVTLTTGKKLIVKESKEDIKNKVIAYKKEIFSNFQKVEFKSALEGSSKNKKDGVLILKGGGK